MRYLHNLGTAVSQLGNAIAGGDPDETISSALGKAYARGSTGALYAVSILEATILPVGHFDRAARRDADEGKDAIR